MEGRIGDILGVTVGSIWAVLKLFFFFFIFLGFFLFFSSFRVILFFLLSCFWVVFSQDVPHRFCNLSLKPLDNQKDVPM